MVAGTTATRTARTSTKSAYKPHVRLLDAGKGLYTVQSERYVHVLYAVDVVNGTCECEAGQRAFKGVKRLGGVCKHLYICRQYHAHRVAYLAATTARPATGEVAASVAPAVTTPAPAFIPAPPAFAQLFAA